MCSIKSKSGWLHRVWTVQLGALYDWFNHIRWRLWWSVQSLGFPREIRNNFFFLKSTFWKPISLSSKSILLLSGWNLLNDRMRVILGNIFFFKIKVFFMKVIHRSGVHRHFTVIQNCVYLKKRQCQLSDASVLFSFKFSLFIHDCFLLK